MPTFSVIIPAYNIENYVAQALNSVLAQTFQDFEIILVDDGSFDHTISIIRQFTDPRVKLIQQENRGASSARNHGIRQSQGQYIAFLDGDDYWLPEKLERQLQHLESFPEVGVSFCRAAFIDDSGVPLGTYQMPQLTDLDAPAFLRSNAIGCGSTPIIRRQVLEAIQFQDNLHGELEVCYFDEHLQRSEDLELWLRILLKTSWKIEGIADPLVYYRINPNSLSSNILKEHESWEQVVEKVRSYAPEMIAQTENLARAYQFRYLSRRAIRLKDGKTAVQFINQALKSDAQVLWKEPRQTFITIIAAYLIQIFPRSLYLALEKVALNILSYFQKKIIQKNSTQS
ncbi:MAG: glycosyltransferase family 2 protein [Microcystaceae cyanobacterium]